MNDRFADPFPDPFAEDAGAYVLGSLDDADRAAFEAHLAACPGCREAVAELAHLPALLATVPPEGLADPPASVLVGLLATVGRVDTSSPSGAGDRPPDELGARRRRRRRAWGAAALTAAAAAGFLVAAAVLPPRGGSAPGVGADVTTVALDAATDAGTVPVVASVALEPVGWGTRLEVTCTYEGGSGDPYGGPVGSPVEYALVVHDAAGGSEQVATWTAVSGRELTVPAGTAVPLDEITRIEMVSDGRVVLSASV